MNIIFSNAYIFPFLLLLALPLLLHLLARKKPPLYDFSSLEFIRKIVKHSIRMKRPKDILLLVLRTLFVLFIVWLFLKPLFFGKGLPGAFSGSRNIVIIVDATASMRYIEAGQTRFSMACAEASEILSGLGKNSKANVIWLKLRPQGIYPGPSLNKTYIQECLAKADANSETGDPATAFELALKMLEGTDGAREICIISDFQNSQWESFKPVTPGGVKLISVKVGNGNAANLAVTRIFVEPAFPLAGEEEKIYAEIKNYSSEPRRTTVFFQLGGLRKNMSVMVPAWGTASSAFRIDGKKAGTYTLEISIGEDLFPEDNQRWAFLNVAPALKIGVCENSKENMTAKFWLRALNAVSWINAESIALNDADAIKKCDIIMLAGWDGRMAETLKEFLASGAGVFCMPAEGMPLQSLSELSGLKKTQAGKALLENLSEPLGLQISAPGDKVFSIFSEGTYGNPAGGTFHRRFNINAGGEVLLRYRDGIPALTRNRNKGTFYFWNMALDGKDGAFAKRQQFLPFLAELLLDARPLIGRTAKHYMPGEEAQLKLSPEMAGREIKLFSPESKLCNIKNRISGNCAILSGVLQSCGVYCWKSGENIIERTIVNFPQIESDLRTVSSKKIESFGILSESGSVKLLHEGLELWPFILAAVMALLLLEGLVMLWAERK
ncbi:MAG: hypothetical protein A2017_11525 [Lentisphaerae bacterium GWF2_44_16]|nr:MAG: hypothetical protein A2017_11525 [Lentisphaerae bacterium GWF2_44_16]